MINLYSDTQTKPTKEMRKFMATAEVGDEQQLLDPNVNKLCEMSANLLGKEDAMFLPSGIMCNLISALTHCRMGDEVIAAENSHIIMMEAGGLALGQISNQTINQPSGIFTADDVETCLAKRRMGKNSLIPKMLSIENTHNFGGGIAWRMEQLNPITQFAKKNNLKLHMDGARMINASVAMNIKMADYASEFDSVWFDLSKGLGCPVGAVLAGSSDFIKQAWIWKIRLGGAMRQAGIIASAGIYALDRHLKHLVKDHKNARDLAVNLNQIDGISINLDMLHTNILIINVKDSKHTAVEICSKLKQQNVAMVALNDDEIRAVTHLDVNADQCEQAAQIFKHIITQ